MVFVVFNFFRYFDNYNVILLRVKYGIMQENFVYVVIYVGMFYSRMIVGWWIGIKFIFLFFNMVGMMYFCKDFIFK